MSLGEQIKDFFEKAWKWIVALWDKHDEYLLDIVEAILPMVIDLAFRNDLTGNEKRKAIVDMIMDNAEQAVGGISASMLNEAVEIAVNRYNIQIGKTTIENIDNARAAALKAGRDYADDKLSISGTEAEDAGIKPVIADIPLPEPAPVE